MCEQFLGLPIPPGFHFVGFASVASVEFPSGDKAADPIQALAADKYLKHHRDSHPHMEDF